MSKDWTETAKKSLDLISSTLRGVDLIGTIAQGKLDTHKADDALAALRTIAGIAEAVKKGFDGTVPSEAVAEYIDKQFDVLRASIAKIDEDTQSAIDKKFPTG